MVYNCIEGHITLQILRIDGPYRWDYLQYSCSAREGLVGAKKSYLGLSLIYLWFNLCTIGVLYDSDAIQPEKGLSILLG